jgi:hypothetical protein
MKLEGRAGPPRRSRRKTWRVLSWASRPEGIPDGEPLPLTCECCLTEAWCPTAGAPGDLMIAVIGMGVVFDHPGHRPPAWWQPDEIECRTCRRVYATRPEVA